MLALLTSSTEATQNKKSMIALATEDDQIAAGSSDWNDIGYIQTKKESADENADDDQNVSISSLNK